MAQSSEPVIEYTGVKLPEIAQPKQSPTTKVTVENKKEGSDVRADNTPVTKPISAAGDSTSQEQSVREVDVDQNSARDGNSIKQSTTDASDLGMLNAVNITSTNPTEVRSHDDAVRRVEGKSLPHTGIESPSHKVESSGSPSEPSTSPLKRDPHQLLAEIKALKAALPTQNEVAMVYAQDPSEGTKLQAYCRGMIRRMQQLEKERRSLANDGISEQRRQTVIQKARMRRDERHMQHVQEFMLKEAARMVKKDETSEAQANEVSTSRATKELQIMTAEQKRQALEAERIMKLEEGVRRWEMHSEKVTQEKEREKEKAKAIRAKRIEELGNVERVGFLLPNGQAPTTNMGAYRAAVAKSSRSSSQLNLLRHSDSEPDNDIGDHLEGSQSNRRLSSSAPLPPPTHHLTRVKYELLERRAKEDMDRELSRKMTDHLRRSELVRYHRKQVAKKMTERTASVPAFKEKQRQEQEEQYQNHLQKVNEEKEQLDNFQQGKQRILLQRVERNKARQDEAQKRVQATKALEEQKHQLLLEKVFKEELKIQKEKEEEARQRKASKVNETSANTSQPTAVSSSQPINPKISKLSQKLIERTERIAQLYAVVPVEAEPVRAPKVVSSPKKVEQPPPTVQKSMSSPKRSAPEKSTVSSFKKVTNEKSLSRSAVATTKSIYPPSAFRAIELLCEVAAASQQTTPRLGGVEPSNKPYSALMLVADIAGVRPKLAASGTQPFYALQMVWEVASNANLPRGRAHNVAVIKGTHNSTGTFRGLKLIMDLVNQPQKLVDNGQPSPQPAIAAAFPTASSEPEAPPSANGFVAESPDHRQHPYVAAMNAVV